MKTKKTFKKVGNKLIIKEEVPAQELSAKEVMESIVGLSNRINNTENQITQAIKQKEMLDDNLEYLNDLLKEYKKFEDWASEIQFSTLKVNLPKAVENAKSEVLKRYKYDDTLTVEQNILQMFHQLKHYVGRDKTLAENVSASMLSAHIYNGSLIGNPWEGKKEEEIKNLLEDKETIKPIA